MKKQDLRLVFSFKKRNDVRAIHDASTSELGEKVLSEQSELRNLTLVDIILK